MFPYYFALCLLGLSLVLVSSQDVSLTIYPHIYTDLNNWPCVRLLNATGTIGCQAPSTGSGVLYQIQTQDGINNFVNNIPVDDSFSIVLPYNLLNLNNIQTLKATNRVTGLLVILHNSNNTSISNINNLYSPESTCPNCQFGLYANDPNKYIWNPQATDLIDSSFQLPIYALNSIDEVSSQVYNDIMTGLTFNKNRNYQTYPLQAVDFNLMMWAAIDSETCLRRGWCQPVGGLSVFSTPSNAISADDNKPIIVISAPMDSRSVFHDFTLGVESSVAGLVTVLAIADALNHGPVSPKNYDKHVLYTLFTAESWGFAGSQRFVQDISEPFVCTNATRAYSCPFANTPCSMPCVRDLNFKNININNIDTIIEFGALNNQLNDNNNNSNDIWAHVDDPNISNSLVQSLISQSNSNNNNNNTNSTINIRFASEDGVQRKLPPSSSMSFLQKKQSIKTVVLSSYQDKINGLYSSDLDDQMDINKLTQNLCGLASVTAQTVYQQAQTSNNNTANSAGINANCTLVNTLLDCLVYNYSCSFMQNYFNVSGLSRISHYSSVYSFNNPQPQFIPRFVFSYLSGVTGIPRLNSNQQPTSCQKITDCLPGDYCIQKQCISSLTSYHPSYGTGLHYDESIGKVGIVDKNKGAYTESTWDAPSLRIFLVPSRRQQYIELVIGILWTIISIMTVFFMKRYTKNRFKLE